MPSGILKASEITLWLDETSMLTAPAFEAGAHQTNLPWEILKLAHLLRCTGENELLFGHGSSIVDGIKLIVHDLNAHGKLCGFGIKFMKVGDLPSHPSIVKVFDLTLQMDEVTTGPKQEEPEPCWEQFNGVLFTMPNCVSLCI